jgi:hypothetical protein
VNGLVCCSGMARTHMLRSVLLREWQGKNNAADPGIFAHSILPKVSLRPWFEGQKEDRKFVSTVSRVMSGHCTARSHLSIDLGLLRERYV